MGLVDTPAQTKALFDSWDEDNSGEMDMDEMRKALKASLDAALKRTADEKAQAKLVGERTRGARGEGGAD